MQYADFAESFLHKNVSNGFWPSTVIPDLYVKRSDVYLRAGKWHSAAVDFRRATNGFPQYASAIERWRRLGRKTPTAHYIDMKTFDDSHSGAAHIWIKYSQGAPDASAPYSVPQYQLNCRARQIQLLSSANYDAGGTVLSASDGGKWESIVPESLGEILINGTCQTVTRAD